MDTGVLSEEIYQAIMIEAELFNHDLILHFGLLSSDCKYENDFIEKSIHLINEIKSYGEIDILRCDDMFFENPPEINDFHIAIAKIIDNIVDVKKIPMENRTYN